MNKAELSSNQRHFDQIEIQNCLYKFVRGVDRRDYDLVRETYHPDAFDDHGDYQGGVEGMIAWLKQRHENIEISYHHIGNIFVEFAGPDDALAEAYVLTWQSIAKSATAKDEEQPVEALFAGRYIDHFKRINGIWRVQYRTAVPESATLMKADSLMKISSGSNWAKGSRDPSDPSYALRAKLKLE